MGEVVWHLDRTDTPGGRGLDEPCPFIAREVALRAVILQGVAAVAAGVDAEPVVAWFQEQGVWKQVSPEERKFLLHPSAAKKAQRTEFQWRQEAEWALLWVVGKVDALGLPTRGCDTRRLVDKIIPALGSDIEPFLASAKLRPPGVLLAEEDRHYDLWCRYIATRKKGKHLIPRDPEIDVLYQREHAFEWSHAIEACSR